MPNSNITAKCQRHISVSAVSVHYWSSLSKRYAKREETWEKGNRKSIERVPQILAWNFPSPVPSSCLYLFSFRPPFAHFSIPRVTPFHLCHLRIDRSVFRQLLTIFVEYSFHSFSSWLQRISRSLCLVESRIFLKKNREKIKQLFTNIKL